MKQKRITVAIETEDGFSYSLAQETAGGYNVKEMRDTLLAFILWEGGIASPDDLYTFGHCFQGVKKGPTHERVHIK